MNKGKERKKREGKQKKGVGIGVKIVALLLLLAVAALSCMGVLVQTLQSVIVTNDEIVAGQVAEQEKISELSRQFTYINGQVLTHVMTTNSVTMENLSDKILQEITDMEQQMTEFEGLLSEGDARREAFDSASAELAKYKKTVESLLVTSAENKTQAYVSATSNLPMFNEHIESYMNQMLEITGEQMAQAQGQMEQSAARVPMIVAVASLVLLAVVVVIMLGLRIWVIGPVKYATRQVDELVEGIQEGNVVSLETGDYRELRTYGGKTDRYYLQCGKGKCHRGGHHPEAGSDGWWHAVCHGGYRRGATGYRGAGYHGGEHAGGGTGWTQLCGGYQG